jgi:hypothetical protein
LFNENTNAPEFLLISNLEIDIKNIVDSSKQNPEQNFLSNIKNIV